MPKPTTDSKEVIPSPQNDRRQRRKFTAEQKAQLVKERPSEVPMTRACAALGLSRATAYRRVAPATPPRRTNHRRIPDAQRAQVLRILDSDRFTDQPPREAYAALLSEGHCHCSWRTMYRILRERAPIRERHNHRERRYHAIPRLCAAAPNNRLPQTR